LLRKWHLPAKQLEELKKKNTTLSDPELAEVETFNQRVRNDHAATPPARVSFEEASNPVRSALHKAWNLPF
jgi:hypothetical protein